MDKKSGTSKASAVKPVKNIRRKTRQTYSAEEKIRIVLAGLRGEESIAAPPRGDFREPVLQLVEGIPGSGQALTVGRRGASGDIARGEGFSFRDRGPEGMRRRPYPRKPIAQKKHGRGWGVRGMRYPATEKLEIIHTVEASPLSTKQTLDMLGVPRPTFYRWYDRYVEVGFDALTEISSWPKSVWNRIPQARRDELIEFALEHEALTTRESAVKYTDEKRYFISESSAYRFLKEADLITAPDCVVIKAADEFTDKTINHANEPEPND